MRISKFGIATIFGVFGLLLVATGALAVFGTVDNTTIGGNTPVAGTFTTIQVNTSINGSTVPATRGYRTMWVGGSYTASPANNATNFFPISGQAASTASAVDAASYSALVGTLRNLNCQLQSMPGGAATYKFSVRQNGVATALTCTVVSASVGCTDSADSITVAVADALLIQSDPTGTPTASKAACSVEFDI